jgi:hypothetical protein
VSEGQGPPNRHVAWRMDVARRVAAGYRAGAPIAALTVAGSVGAGLADRYSDLELDCYWTEPPSDQDRRHPVEVARGVLTGFWDYDADDAEWSEDYQLGDLGVTVSNFTVGAVEAFLDDVTLRADTSAVKHMRLAAILRCSPLSGESLVLSWRERASRYTDALAAAMVRQALAPEVLTGWAGREALVSRGRRDQAEALMLDVADLATGSTGADLGEFRAALADRRPVLEPPADI